MRKLHWIFIIAIICVFACSRSQSHFNDIIDQAEALIDENPDSATAMLEVIEPNELTVDSIKAKYHYVIASAHNGQGHPNLSDSLIRHSFDFYKGKNLKRYIRSGTLLATYKYWIGDNQGAFSLLDSLSSLKNVPDSLLVFPLRKSVYLRLRDYGTHHKSRQTTKRLLAIDKDSAWQEQYKAWLYISYLYTNIDSALIVIDDLIDKATAEKAPLARFSYEYEKIGVLEELGRYSECINLADRFLTQAPGNSVQHYIHMWKSLALLNMGQRNKALQELAKADSCAAAISENEKNYYNSFAYILNTFFDYQKTGKISLINMAQINNAQKNNILRTQAIQREAEKSALEIENKRLLLKARSEKQTAIIIIVILATLLISGGLLWYALNKKRKALEAAEQAETLQKLVDELNAAETNLAQNETLRRAMLQQLGIIKMVAETPTEQNREMLRKLSSIDSKDTSLVNWNNVYDIIDNLYSGFYTRLHKTSGDVLTEKEEQIIVLMMAGFSTKEISVISSQTTASIYVRKSAIRKKLGVPEKEDIVAFLRQKAAD
ncbi:MAG: LuxR C-terminal-related transcriptional regulator [Muribaculaceae bacterium]|nr:LuxR C-terminal-related transcriptional regulator [Muribaculaceae bacterium]